MKSKFILSFIFLSFLINFGNSSRLIFASEILKENKTEKLSIDYLKKDLTSDYILGPGDFLKINVSRDYPELNSSVRIDREGTLYLPKIKRVYVEGLSLNEFNKLLTEAFREFVKFPSVEASIIEYRPIRIYVDGEVENPGLQTLGGAFSISANKEDESSERDDKDSSINQPIMTNYFPTVFDAIRSAGGITRFSNLAEIELIRVNTISEGGGRKKTVLDFEKLIYDGDISQNIRVYDGDTLNIKKSEEINLLQISRATKSNLNAKFINVFISGRVNSPGNLKVSKSSTLNDAIDIAGGAKVLKGKTRFVRFNNDGTLDRRKISYSKRNKRGSYENPFLKEGDLILIDNSLLSSTNEVISEVTQPFAGLFSAYGLLKAISD